MNNPLYRRTDLSRMYLPAGQLLQIDRVAEMTEDIVRCEMDLQGHWAFPLHFPHDPIFPACLMIEAAGQAIAIWAWHHQMPGLPRLARVEASFLSAVLPDNKVLSLVGTIRRRRNICVGNVELSCGPRRIGEVKETLAWVTDGTGATSAGTRSLPKIEQID